MPALLSGAPDIHFSHEKYSFRGGIAGRTVQIHQTGGNGRGRPGVAERADGGFSGVAGKDGRAVGVGSYLLTFISLRTVQASNSIHLIFFIH